MLWGEMIAKAAGGGQASTPQAAPSKPMLGQNLGSGPIGPGIIAALAQKTQPNQMFAPRQEPTIPPYNQPGYQGIPPIVPSQKAKGRNAMLDAYFRRLRSRSQIPIGF